MTHLHSTRVQTVLAVLALLIAFAAPPAAADWLVTLDGDRIQTEGPWSIKGKLVVFALPGGGLSSLRLADIDVDASDELTNAAQASRHRTKAKQPTREAVFVLTDNDVGHVDTRLQGSLEERKEAGAEARAEAIRTAAATEDGLSVSDWEDSFQDNIDGVVLTGRLQNRSRDIQTEITLQVVLYSLDGTLVGRAPAVLDQEILNPKGSTSFKATFAGVLNFDRPDFEIDSISMAMRAENQTEPQDETLQ